MNGSYNFLVHIIGFGLLSGGLFFGFVLDRQLRKEKEWTMKLSLAGMMRKIGILSPFIAAILLITGIGNIQNRLMGVEISWYDEGWLVAKIICFVIMLLNGILSGPALGKKRAGFIKAMVDKTGTEETEKQYNSVNGQITMFYVVQLVLLLSILYLSTFGPGKHPGMM